MEERIRTQRTRRGARLVQDGAVLSEILRRPGPTHDLFDILAACIAMLAPGPRLAMLGFAGGGIVAPLRKMGFARPVDAVDLSSLGVDLYRELSAPWAFEVRLEQAEASAWLARRRAPYDAILEDLSVPGSEGVTKPRVSLEVLPELIQRRLGPGGVAITNLLPVPGMSWRSLLARVAATHRSAQLIQHEDYENRVLVAGESLVDARKASRLLRRALHAIGSRLAAGVRLRRYR
ncbi:MAG: hypothetical protein ACE5F1_18785 [Planctomycetota bacterium]